MTGLFKRSSSSKPNIPWIDLQDESQLEEVIQQSKQTEHKGVIIYKHSTRCGISSMVKRGLEKSWDFTEEELPAYHLDLIKYRELSNKVAELFEVPHASPQVLLIKDGKCIFHTSHNNISVEAIKSQAA